MDFSEAQRVVIDRYLDATKHCPQDRISFEKLVGMKKRFPKSKPDKYVISRGEAERTDDSLEVKAGRKKRVTDNSYVVEKLQGYDDYHLAANDFCWLDDVFTGVTNVAFEGATRELSIYLVFDFLSTARQLDSDLIMDVCKVAERQARKILAALRVCSEQVAKQFRRMDVEGLQHERRFFSLT